jgi:hypothetical protein
MDIWDQIDAIMTDPALSEVERLRAVQAAKAAAIADLLNNGKAPPNPVPAAIGQTYRLDGVDYTVHHASAVVMNGVPALRIVLSGVRVADGALLINPADDLIFVNPPTLTRTRAKDLSAAAREMLAGLV